VDRADGYRRYAVECLRVAREATNPNDKAMLLEMAQRWQELAERIEQQAERSEVATGGSRRSGSEGA
jgi:hypothetical protein